MTRYGDTAQGRQGDLQAEATSGELIHVRRVDTTYTYRVRWGGMEGGAAGIGDLPESTARTIAAAFVQLHEVTSVSVDAVPYDTFTLIPITDLHREQFAALIAWSAEKCDENTCAVRL